AGNGFGTSNGSGASCTSKITFNGTLAHPTTWNTNSIVVPVPNLATTGPIVVTVADPSSCALLTSNGVTFTVPVGSTGTIAGLVSSAVMGVPVGGLTVQALQGGNVQA